MLHSLVPRGGRRIFIQIFPYACPGFARTFRRFVFKNAAFYCVFRDFWDTRNCYPRLRTRSKPRVFMRFSRFSDLVEFGSFLVVFSKKKHAKTIRFHTFLMPRGRASAPAFSSFSCARCSKTCRKLHVFMRFSRFSGRVAHTSFFEFALGRFLMVFLKRCENHAFSRVFRDSAANPTVTSGLRKLIFCIPGLRCGLTGLV